MTIEEKRVHKKVMDLPLEKVQDFFNDRAKKYTQNNPYISILYQDKNPQLALTRDSAEKKKILPLLKVTSQSSVLDIGCGIGRWADVLLSRCKSYIGIDFCDALIKQASERIENPRAQFYQCAAEDINSLQLDYVPSFNLVIISGVFLYMNDDKIIHCLKECKKLLAGDAKIYIREPLSLKDRLTLNGVWSNDLNYEYYSIYRNAEEMIHLIMQGFNFNDDYLIKFNELYDDEMLNNRKETQQFYCLLEWSSNL